MPEITQIGIFPLKKNTGMFAQFQINDILYTIVGGLVLSKIFNIGLIKSTLGLFFVLIVLKMSFGVDSGAASDIISELSI